MDKLPSFCNRRKENFKEWYRIFFKYPQYFILPEATSCSDPAWFAFIVSIKQGSPFTRDELTGYLNKNLIETRNLFAGNLTKQPGYINKNWRIEGTLDNTDYIMNNTFFLGTYPGMSVDMFNYSSRVIDSFIGSQAK
jgi:CDP-6-deoxy-D-xylo-4-hexulose-3-dehydrase